jgi:rhamnosyltransferase
MRVLAHIHTFNDADVIGPTIDAVRRQTRPVDEILVVDNGSTDSTLQQSSLKHATLLRHSQNTGTSGAVCSGFRFALERDYDWVWVFDADSCPEPDALQRLLDLYQSWPRALQDETAFLACVNFNVPDGLPRYGGMFTAGRFAPIRETPEPPCYPCHVTIWSGCLYRLAAVRRIGLPNADYVLDWGEAEYGYRIMKAGYKGFTDQHAILRHHYDHTASRVIANGSGSAAAEAGDSAPIRCYYTCRNVLYFALYDFAESRVGFICRSVRRVFLFQLRYLVRPWTHTDHIRACLRGIWDGVTGNIAARY